MDKRFIFRYRQHRATWGRRRVDRAGRLDMVRALVQPVPEGKSAGIEVRPEPSATQGGMESLTPHCQEKPLSDDVLAPVPQTDTGR